MRHDFKKYLNPVFIETGSLQGKGIQAAIDAGFQKVISIEPWIMGLILLIFIILIHTLPTQIFM